MQVARAHQNTVLLPDGSMVIVGGGTGEVPRMWATTDAHHRVELYDAQAGRWRLGPAQRGDRAYHSTAVLLPDGSVVSAGDDDLDDGDIDTYEVYRPPYFFRGPRPIITAAPRTVAYGATMPVRTPNTDIVRAVLMAPGATTHAVDMSQRAISMPVVRRADGTGYDVATPLDANIALPGHHMLFLVDSAGRPSVASWVRLDPDAAEAPPPTPVPVDGPAEAQPDPGGDPGDGGTAAPAVQAGEGGGPAAATPAAVEHRSPAACPPRTRGRPSSERGSGRRRCGESAVGRSSNPRELGVGDGSSAALTDARTGAGDPRTQHRRAAR
jgi:hypothetical protein